MSDRLTELSTLKVSDLGDLARKQIAEDIITELEEKRVGRQLLREETTLQGGEGSQLVFVKRTGMKARPVAAGATFPEKDISYNNQATIDVYKYALNSDIRNETIEDGREDDVAATEEELGRAIADQEDIVALAGLAGCSRYQTTTSSDGSGNLTLSNTPVFVVDSIVDGSGNEPSYSITKESGSVSNLANSTSYTITYWAFSELTPTGSTTDNGNVDVPDDLLNIIRANITANKYDPDTLVVNSSQLANIMNNNQFLDASQFGSADVVRDGVIGRIYGLDVVVASQMPNKYTIGFDSEAEPAVFLPKRELQVDTKDKAESDVFRIFVSQRMGAGLVNPDAVEVINLDSSL